MARPSKSSATIQAEQKSHRTKAEMKQREDAEKELSTGVALKERAAVKNNPIAHKEFNRVNALLKKIGKNDAIYEPIINRYCALQAECVEYESMLADFRDQRGDLRREYQSGQADADCVEGGLTPSAYYKLLSVMQKSIVDLDKQIQAKRKMLFDIERENAMTIAAALRSIPKKVEKEKNPLLAALTGDD